MIFFCNFFSARSLRFRFSFQNGENWIFLKRQLVRLHEAHTHTRTHASTTHSRKYYVVRVSNSQSKKDSLNSIEKEKSINDQIKILMFINQTIFVSLLTVRAFSLHTKIYFKKKMLILNRKAIFRVQTETTLYILFDMRHNARYISWNRNFPWCGAAAGWVRESLRVYEPNSLAFYF